MEAIKPKKIFQREIAINFIRFLDKLQKWRGMWRIENQLLTLKKNISSNWIPLPKGQLLCTTNHNFKMIINPEIDKGVERSIYYTGTYEAGTMYVLSKLLHPGDIFLDIGANVGLMSLLGAKNVGHLGKVFSFEPVPEMYDLLISNIQVNGFKNISSNNVALGSKDEVRSIYLHPEINRGSSSMVEFGDIDEGHKVEITTLDRFAEQQTIEAISLLKIDVEGWELEVLKGATEVLSGKNAPIICIEYSNEHPQHNGDLEDIFRLITNVNDYKCFKLKSGKSRPSKLVPVQSISELPEHDNLFCFLSKQIEQNQELF